MKTLTPDQTVRAVQLLDAIVRPGDHDFWDELKEAQILLGYAELPKPKVVKARPLSGRGKRATRYGKAIWK